MPDDTADTVFNQAATTKKPLCAFAPSRPGVAFSTVLACFLVAPAAMAMEGGDVAGHPLTVDVTETALSANIDADGTVNEFSLVQYSAPPTTLPVYVDTEANFFNVCVSGGRGRLDARATDDLLVYGWVGRYASWSESGSVDCDIDAKNRNDIWDTAVGVEALFEKKRSHAFLSVGARDDQLARKRDTAAPTSEVYDREGYVRYDLVKALTPTLYLQVQGTVRRRHDESKTPIPWWEGENYTGLQWSPHLSVAFGYEHLTAAGHPGSYYNGAVKWRIDPDKSLRLFMGQQRGALRCISGVCREFPAFEGAKAEAVVRF